ncbi:MAG: hypothetical protein K5665_00900 [Saccharofermentans sp.]|nr:hypothetical protein [Saccharofermentans sp.]
MIVRSIKIVEGLYSKTIEFDSFANLIHSSSNSQGKTTLIRFLLYSLGYSIPNTKNVKFERCSVEVDVFFETVGDIRLKRTAINHIVLLMNDEETTYVLPEQLNDLQALLFGNNNYDVLNNLLGAFYVDQEKGWTLLNRGVVIGSIHFNIEELVRGLSGRDCSDLIKREKSLSSELGKYRQMFSVAKYQETIQQNQGDLVVEHYDEIINTEIEQLVIQKNQLKKELRRIDKGIKDNKQFQKYISDMKLLVQGPDGTIIPVTESNVVGLNDNFNFLITKRNLVAADLSDVLKRITECEDKSENAENQLSFWESESLTHAFDRRIAALQVDPIVVDKEIKRIEAELKQLRKIKTDETQRNNSVVASLYNNIIKYAKELGIGNDETMAASYLFTHNLKELTGAILHKTVFAFRLAYIIEIERALNVKLPIILDSPSGKEVDKDNIRTMINILKRDFMDHQIIIASIYKYDFDSPNTIEIEGRLINELNS